MNYFPFLKKSICSLTALSLFVSFGLSALAEASVKARVAQSAVSNAPKGNQLLKAVFESVHSVDQLLLVTALSGATKESMQAIQADLDQQLKGVNFPKVSLTENEIVVDGQKTGVWIDPNMPTRIRFQGKTWLYDKNAPTDKNYFSLMSFLRSEKKSAGIMSLLIPEAYADEDSGRTWAQVAGGAGGVAVSVVAGMIASGVIAVGLPAALAGLFGLLALNAIINIGAGVMIGEAIYDQKKVNAFIADLVNSAAVYVECTPGKSLLKVKTKTGEMKTIEFDKGHSNAGSKYARLIGEKPESAINVASFKVDAPIYDQMMSCSNADEAEAIYIQLKDAMGKVKAAKGSSKEKAAPAIPGTELPPSADKAS